MERGRVLYVTAGGPAGASRADALRAQGFEVQIAESFDDAERELDRRGTDCILSDSVVDGEDALSFLERVRASRPDLPFVLLTPDTSAMVLERAVDAGVTDYVPDFLPDVSSRLLARRLRMAIRSDSATPLRDARATADGGTDTADPLTEAVRTSLGWHPQADAPNGGTMAAGEPSNGDEHDPSVLSLLAADDDSTTGKDAVEEPESMLGLVSDALDDDSNEGEAASESPEVGAERSESMAGTARDGFIWLSLRPRGRSSEGGDTDDRPGSTDRVEQQTGPGDSQTESKAGSEFEFGFGPEDDDRNSGDATTASSGTTSADVGDKDATGPIDRPQRDSRTPQDSLASTDLGPHRSDTSTTERDLSATDRDRETGTVDRDRSPRDDRETAPRSGPKHGPPTTEVNAGSSREPSGSHEPSERSGADATSPAESARAEDVTHAYDDSSASRGGGDEESSKETTADLASTEPESSRTGPLSDDEIESIVAEVESGAISESSTGQSERPVDTEAVADAIDDEALDEIAAELEAPENQDMAAANSLDHLDESTLESLSAADLRQLVRDLIEERTAHSAEAADAEARASENEPAEPDHTVPEGPTTTDEEMDAMETESAPGQPARDEGSTATDHVPGNADQVEPLAEPAVPGDDGSGSDAEDADSAIAREGTESPQVSDTAPAEPETSGPESEGSTETDAESATTGDAAVGTDDTSDKAEAAAAVETDDGDVTEQFGEKTGYDRPPGLDLEPGTSVLVQCGSQDDRRDAACVDLLDPDHVADRNVLLIRYRRMNESRLERIAQHANRTKLITIGYNQQVPRSVEDAVDTVKINNPNDVTRLGIVVTGTVDDWTATGAATVVCFDPLDALLQYKGVQSVFRFLHLFIGKLTQSDVVSHFHVDPSAGDPQEINVLKPLFDAVLTVDSVGTDLEST